MEEEDGMILTPYERNLEFWRQLWRCVERSDVLVQILDARDPEFYRCKDLERYIEQFPDKRHVLLLNKVLGYLGAKEIVSYCFWCIQFGTRWSNICNVTPQFSSSFNHLNSFTASLTEMRILEADFLTSYQRETWAKYLSDLGAEGIFFSALRELHRQQRAPVESESDEEDEDDEDAVDAVPNVPSEPSEPSKRLPPHGSLEDSSDVIDCSKLIDELQSRMPVGRRGVVGFVGYPNVGKSSVINALFGVKKVSMSRTPGKTKHLQTLELADSNITLCDCPGLVFPSIVATRSHLVINGTVPLDELKDFVDPIRLIVAKIGPEPILKKYGVSAAEVKDGAIRRGVGEASDEMAHQANQHSSSRKHYSLLAKNMITVLWIKVCRDMEWDITLYHKKMMYAANLKPLAGALWLGNPSSALSPCGRSR